MMSQLFKKHFHTRARPHARYALGSELGLNVLSWIKCLPQDCTEDFIHGLAIEGEVARQQHVHDDAAAPDVGLLSVVPLHHFWRHVLDCAQHIGQFLRSREVRQE